MPIHSVMVSSSDLQGMINDTVSSEESAVSATSSDSGTCNNDGSTVLLWYVLGQLALFVRKLCRLGRNGYV